MLDKLSADRQPVDLAVMCTCVLSRFSHVRLFATLRTVARRFLCPWVLQARILEWATMSSLQGNLSDPGIFQILLLQCRRLLHH